MRIEAERASALSSYPGFFDKLFRRRKDAVFLCLPKILLKKNHFSKDFCKIYLTI